MRSVKVPSDFVFSSARFPWSLSARNTIAAAIGSPAEFLTVPSIVIPSDCGDISFSNAAARGRLKSTTAKKLRANKKWSAEFLKGGPLARKQFITMTDFAPAYDNTPSKQFPAHEKTADVKKRIEFGTV